MVAELLGTKLHKTD